MKPLFPFLSDATLRRLAALRPALLLMGATGLGAAPAGWNITVVGDLTDGGRKLATPSRSQPTYYVPVVIGLREEGGIQAGNQPPPKDFILATLAKALASQGYLSIGAKTPEPSLLLTLSWGAINPVIEYDHVETPSASPEGPPGMSEIKRVANAPVMTALVAGRSVEELRTAMPSYMTDYDREAADEAITDDRFFVSVVAFDWTAVKAHKREIMWATKISVPSRGVTLAEVLPALIKNGAPFFGRETVRPAQIDVPAVPPGRVEVGTPRVVSARGPEGGRP